MVMLRLIINGMIITKYLALVTHLRFYFLIYPVVILRPRKEGQKHHHFQLM